jgi:DHA1 family tetracycline resistance protein-like MFS transporter
MFCQNYKNCINIMFSKKSVSLFIVALVGFIDWMGIGLVYPMFSSMLFQGDFNLLAEDASDTCRGTCLGILLAAHPLTQFFSAPILGTLSDQKGRRKILIPGLAIGVVGYLIAMTAVHLESYPLLLLSRIAVGISAGTAAIVGASLADVSSSAEKAKNFGLFNMACGLGFTVGPLLGGILYESSIGIISGYAVPFAVAGSVTLLNLLLVALFFEETFVPKIASKISLAAGIHNIQKAFKSKGLPIFFLAIFFAGVGWSFYWEFAPVTWITLYGFNTTMIGNCYAYGAAFYALSCGLLIRPILSRYSNQNVLYVALFGVALSIGMLLLHDDPLWLFLYIPLQQFCVALFWPTSAAVVSNSVNEEMQGEILGVLHSVDSAAFALSPLLAGPLLGITALMPIVVGTVCFIFASAILRLYLKPLRIQQTP